MPSAKTDNRSSAWPLSRLTIERTLAVVPPLAVARLEHSDTFFSSMPGVGSEAPNRNSAMSPSVISRQLLRQINGKVRQRKEEGFQNYRVREGSAEDFHLGYTQWSVIADMSHKVYYYWTMYDRRMRSVDLSKLDFAGKAISTFPLDKVRTEDIQDRSADFPH